MFITKTKLKNVVLDTQYNKEQKPMVYSSPRYCTKPSVVGSHVLFQYLQQMLLLAQ